MALVLRPLVFVLSLLFVDGQHEADDVPENPEYLIHCFVHVFV